MKNISSMGMALATLLAIPASAFATSTVQQGDGILQQEQPDWIEALPVLEALYPTLLQEIRAANLLIHEMDTIHIGSPTYEQAHRLLLQNLLMMERQLSFNPVDLARFQASSHPDRSTVDQSIYPRGNADGSKVVALPPAVVRTGSTSFVMNRYVNRPSRRSIVADSEEQNRVRLLD